MPILRKPVPDVLLGQLLVMGHAPDLGNSLRLVCPTMRGTLMLNRDLTEEVEDWNRRSVSTKPTLTVR